MKRQDHPPAYVLRMKRQWRVVVPIRGRLTPKICAKEFPSRSTAEAWLRSDEAECEIEIYRSRLAPAC
jgi:hypothetical protein